MSPRPTVYDRMKKTGYMMGPRHAMGPAFDDAAQSASPPPPEPGGETAQSPPNLRDSGTSPDSCGVCEYFASNHCDQFDVDLTPNLLCDKFEPAKPEGPENEEGTTESTAPPQQAA